VEFGSNLRATFDGRFLGSSSGAGTARSDSSESTSHNAADLTVTTARVRRRMCARIRNGADNPATTSRRTCCTDAPSPTCTIGPRGSSGTATTSRRTSSVHTSRTAATIAGPTTFRVCADHESRKSANAHNASSSADGHFSPVNTKNIVCTCGDAIMIDTAGHPPHRGGSDAREHNARWARRAAP
jgi:hypothetical protein